MRKYVVCTLLVALSSLLCGQTYNISTVAGSVKNANGDGVSAVSAPLLNPQQVVVDSAGNVYIADGDAHRVRKIDGTTGIMTVIAGQGRTFAGPGVAPAGSLDTPGPGATTSLLDPVGLALDQTRKILYIAERDNNKIKALDLATGMMTTLVGFGGRAGYAGDGALTPCAGTNAVCGALYSRIRAPQQLAVDSLGNLYIADRGNNKIRKVCIAAPVKSTDCVQGTITTVAGIGPYNADPLWSIQANGDGGLATKAQLARPEAVAVDSAFNVYIADTNNNKIRKVDAATGIISTVVGTCVQGAPISTTAGGDPLNGTFVVPPNTPWPICGAGTEGTAATPLAITAANGKLLTTFVDGTLGVNSTLNKPRSLAFDSAGNLYIADNVTFRIRQYNPNTLIVTTVVGSGTAAGFAGDGGRANAALLNQPRGIAVGPNGDLYIADQTQGQISSASALARLRVVDGTNQIIRTITAGAYFGDGGTGANAAFNDPRGLSADPLGNVYIADSNNNRVRKLGTDGTMTRIAGTGTAASSGDLGPAAYAALNNPTCAAVDSANNVYIADRANGRVRKVDAYGNIATVAGGGPLTAATDGILAAANPSVPGTGALLTSPRCVALDPTGNLYIADNNTVRKVDANGIITTVAGTWIANPFAGLANQANYININAPCAITQNASGLSQQCYGAGNTMGTQGGPGTSLYLSGVQGLAVDPAGKYLYLSDGYHVVYKVDICSGAAVCPYNTSLLIGDTLDGGATGAPAGITVPAGGIGPAVLSLLNVPIGLAADNAGNVYIADSNNYRVVKVDISGNAFVIAGGGLTWGDNAAATSVALTMPRGVAVDATGNVYVTEALGIIRKLAPAK